MYLIGYDIGTSSIKATLIDSQTGQVKASASSPEREMPIDSPKPGWAQQDPMMWWENVKAATGRVLAKSGIRPADIGSIGISYQMHGLVVVDKDQNVLRPAIIWCDSRAVEIGNSAFNAIGQEVCLERLLNSPGNFTASKLAWVKQNEPSVYAKIYKAMLPGDFIAMKMSGSIQTTVSGLSEGMLWDYKDNKPADIVLKQYGIDQSLLADVVPTFGVQAKLSAAAAKELGLNAGTPVCYRAGDQPNNAFSLNVLNPGEIAATAGTSGVVYGVGSQRRYDPKSRVNTFAHVNYKPEDPHYGVLLCVNGTGILNSWLKHNCCAGRDYPEMNELAARAPVGSDGLCVLPYGNGAERTLENKFPGACVDGLNFSIHNTGHLLRAGQEGIAFALNYGIDIMRSMGLEIKTVRAGYANMFLSPVFAEAFANVTGAAVELYECDGSQGAARAAGVGAGVYKSFPEAFVGLKRIKGIEPKADLAKQYGQAYQHWLGVLEKSCVSC